MNATGRVTQLLEHDDPAQVEAYERAFYVGFQRATHNRLVQWLWEWDHASRRVRTRIPYADQRIWVSWNGEAIADAVAVNVTLRAFQASAYGFTIPPELAAAAAAGKVCEFLTFFAVGGHALAVKRALWHELFGDLRAAGFTHALATGAPKVFPIHRWIGAAKIGEAQIEGEVRNFLCFDLGRTVRA